MSKEFLISHSSNGIVDYGIEHADVGYSIRLVADAVGTLAIPTGAKSYLVSVTPGATVWFGPDAIPEPAAAWTLTTGDPNPVKRSLQPDWTVLNYRAINAADVKVSFYF